ncbi:PRC-barrel domain-containing protein [Phormidium tenue FACHB-886]|nr:PRC-barrel domain-containing protein [Phormidium tenue FACHB-886]
MDLFRISDSDPQSRHAYEFSDIIRFDVWANNEERVGKVADILMNDIGQLYYIVIDIGSWLSRKLVLVEPEEFRIDRATQRVNLINLTKDEINHRSTYDPSLHRATKPTGTRVEPAVHSASSQAIPQTMLPVEASAQLETSAPLGSAWISETTLGTTRSISVPAHRQEHPLVETKTSLQPVPEVVQPLTSQPMASQSLTSQPLASQPVASTVAEETIQLLEERLVVNRLRRKVGEITVRKAIETRMIQVPVRREKLIIEQVSPEPKQIAVVDISTQASEAELATAAQTALDSIERNRFVSADFAQQILAAVPRQTGNHTPKVKLVFEDATLQTKYEEYLLQAANQHTV